MSYAENVTVTTNNDKTGYALTTQDWNVGKTGYALTAGSYSVRASSMQRGLITNADAANNGTATISSVTTTRAQEILLGSISDGVNEVGILSRMTLTNSTTITATKGDSTYGGKTSWGIMEIF